MGNSRLLIENYAGVVVVTFQDSSILDMAVIDQIGKDLYELADKQNKQKLVLDFSNVKFLASQALGVLLTLHKKCQAIKGNMVLCGLRKDLMKVFSITNLDKIFKFFPDDAAALGHFKVSVR
ncbi:MAG: STAS domain-containing protein [Phycisphaerales bacterium]|nr:STAS domain-containing protein [Phycisphaerales bacterium]